MNFFSSQISNGTDNGYEQNNTEEFSLNECYISYEFDDEEAHERRQSETQWKTIPMKDYNDMKELIPLVKKLNIAIDKMEQKIKSKDLELRILRTAYQRLQNTCVNVSNLTTVNIFVNVKIFSPESLRFKSLCLRYYFIRLFFTMFFRSKRM